MHLNKVRIIEDESFEKLVYTYEVDERFHRKKGDSLCDGFLREDPRHGFLD
jgi:hypothetical protein